MVHNPTVALRTAINETLSSLQPVPLRDSLPTEVKQLLADHLRHLLQQEAALLTVAAPAMGQPEAPTDAETHWYPDDSGEWVEHDGSDVCPVPTDCRVFVMSQADREAHATGYIRTSAGGIQWKHVVAYKVVL